MADFPNDTEDEVINPANITTEIDGETYQVMLDFNGRRHQIEFSAAYANEAQRIANEQRSHEKQRMPMKRRASQTALLRTYPPAERGSA